MEIVMKMPKDLKRKEQESKNGDHSGLIAHEHTPVKICYVLFEDQNTN